MVNKKSQVGITDRGTKIVVYVFLLTVLIFTFIVFAFTFRTPYVPEDLDLILLTERFTNTCFTFEDPDTSRFYPGIIDLTDFNQEKLDSCFYLEEEVHVRAFKLKLEYEQESKTLQTSNWLTLKNFNVIVKNVLVFKDNEIQRGILRIAYQEP